MADHISKPVRSLSAQIMPVRNAPDGSHSYGPVHSSKADIANAQATGSFAPENEPARAGGRRFEACWFIGSAGEVVIDEG